MSIEGPVDEATGMVYNLERLKDAMKQVHEKVDHKNLDLVIAFALCTYTYYLVINMYVLCYRTWITSGWLMVR